MSGDTVGILIIFIGYGIIVPVTLLLVNSFQRESREVSLKTTKYLLEEMSKKDKELK